MLGKSLTRISVLPDSRRLLLGIDKDNIFEAGVVYEVYKILDEIIIRPAGKFALPEKGHPSVHSEANAIIYYGTHLMTKEEIEEINEKNIEF